MYHQDSRLTDHILFFYLSYEHWTVNSAVMWNRTSVDSDGIMLIFFSYSMLGMWDSMQNTFCSCFFYQFSRSQMKFHRIVFSVFCFSCRRCRRRWNQNIEKEHIVELMHKSVCNNQPPWILSAEKRRCIEYILYIFHFILHAPKTMQWNMYMDEWK